MLALIPFSAPLLLFFLPYNLAFALLLCLLIAKLFFHIRFHLSKNASFLFLICVFFCASTIGNRYDLIPSVFVLFSLIAAEKKSFLRSYIFLTAAALLKIYPLILFLPLFLAEQHIWKGKPFLFWKRYRLLGLSCAGFCISLFAAYVLSGGNALSFIGFMLTRPLQIESVSTSFLWILSLVHQFSFCITFSYGSFGILTTHASSCVPLLSPSLPVIGVTTIAALTFVVGTIIAALRLYTKKWSIIQTAIALLLLTLCTSKVLSPQYFIWLIPLVVWHNKSHAFWLSLWLLLLFLTAVIHPWLYRSLEGALNNPIHTSGEILFFTVVLLRNLVLLAATIVWYCQPATIREPK